MINLPDPGPYEPDLELFKLRLFIVCVAGVIFFALAVVLAQ